MEGLKFAAADWKKRLDWFLSSQYFIILIAAAVLLFWGFGAVLPAIVVLVLAASALLVTQREGRAMMTVAVLFVMSISRVEPLQTSTFAIFAAVLLPILAGCIVYRMVRIFLASRTFTLGNLFWGLVIAGVVSLFGGLGYNPNYLSGMLKTFAWSLAGFAFYFLFLNYLSGKGLARYVSRVLMYAALVVCAQIVIYYAKVFAASGLWSDVLEAFNNKTIEFGWAVSNNAAVVPAIAIPVTLYLSVKSRYNYIYILLTVLFFIGIIFTFSRGNLIFIGLAVVPMSVYTFVKTERKKAFLITALCIAVATVVCCAVFFQELVKIFDFFIETGLGDRGRLPLYQEAVRDFLASPFFGTGVFFKQYKGLNWYAYHCTILQLLANFGIVGLIGYSLFFYQRYAVFVKKINVFKVFGLISLLIFELYALMDITFYNLYLIFFIFILTIAAEKDEEEERVPDGGGSLFYAKNA